MNVHIKSHNNYQCNQCDKSFKYLGIMKKHIKITQENAKLYFHYFNNNIMCPFNEGCLFLHEDADICKYGKLCERMFCKYNHEPENDKEHSDDGENIISDNVYSVTTVPEDELSYIVYFDDKDDMEYENYVPHTIFLNPSQDDKLSSVNTFFLTFIDSNQSGGL